MARPKRHMIPTRQGWVWSGLYLARFYGPRLRHEWGWFEASHLVKNHKEALDSFREWVDITKAYINGQI
jgi:hypothetical protein